MRAETYEEVGYWEARADYLEHELKRAFARIDALESTVEDLNREALSARGTSTEEKMRLVWEEFTAGRPAGAVPPRLETAAQTVASMAAKTARLVDARHLLQPETLRRTLVEVAVYASRLLPKGSDPLEEAIAEYRRAARKHPGMTLECDGHTDSSRLFALLEEVGEVSACLTYDNTDSTGHNSDLKDEAVQVIGLALAWATRYLES